MSSLNTSNTNLFSFNDIYATLDDFSEHLCKNILHIPPSEIQSMLQSDPLMFEKNKEALLLAKRVFLARDFKSKCDFIFNHENTKGQKTIHFFSKTDMIKYLMSWGECFIVSVGYPSRSKRWKIINAIASTVDADPKEILPFEMGLPEGAIGVFEKLCHINGFLTYEMISSYINSRGYFDDQK